MKGLFFFESIGVPEGSPELGNGNSGWVPSLVHLFFIFFPNKMVLPYIYLGFYIFFVNVFMIIIAFIHV